ncbi:3-methylmercaptopropionyl-CoA dehydrogenase [Diplonema papillatum]|nr:3-methylmercaptopropionyl-CoA dehydrogenase [Diplonema papillatum]
MSLSKGARCVVQRRCLTYKAPARDIKFIFDDVLHMYDHYKTNYPKDVSDECSPEFVDDILEATGQLAEEVLLPLYMPGDAGCVWKDGNVTTPKGFKEAFDQYKEGGWQGLPYPKEYDGMGLPLSLSLIKNEICATGNWSWFMYPGLTLGCINTVILHGSQEMKDFYVPKLINLEWTGTMCLTEPHCGTDLGQMKTKAVEGENGSYKLTGTKIFISSGEHDMADNIVHIVLAKLPGAPEGTKGISLFLVPKYLVNDDGSLQKEKNVKCGSIEKKMGIHGCSTAQLHFEDSVGWLIGEPHDGLRQMFTFMNTARIGTGIQGIAHMELAFQNAVKYANERLAMRSLSGIKEKDKPGDSIIYHGDVRKNLMTCKAILEASRCMIFDVSKVGDLVDLAQQKKDHNLEKELDNEIGFLTPIVKGCITEWGCEVASLCMQVYGGHGYIKDHGMEQIVRDARIATLYEGTTGIQGLDMLGRKMMMDKMKLFNKWNKKLRSYAFSIITSNSTLRGEAMRLYKMIWAWRMNAYKIAYNASKNRDTVSSASVDHLFAAGYLFLGYYWLRMGDAATKKLSSGKLSAEDKIFYQGKVDTCKFYFSHIISRNLSHSAAMIQPPDNLYKIDRDHFTVSAS